jgi:hypothetical protein
MPPAHKDVPVTKQKGETEMKKLIQIVGMVAALSFGLIIPPGFAGDSHEGGYSPEMQAKIDEVKKELKKFTDERASVEKNIKTFDELDFVVFSNQEWTRLHESHSKDVKVNWHR